MRAAIYVRVSTSKQDADNQLLQLRPYCERSGYEVVCEHSDVMSGKETSRPAYDRLFQEAHQHLFDVVVFWALDRFSRAGTLYTLQKLKELENLGIEWDSYQEPYLRSAGQFKDVVLAVIATVARMERERLSERTKAGINKPGVRERVGKRGKDKRPRSRAGYFKPKKGYLKKSPSPTSEIPAGIL
ncbi:MAG: recombinase family protein [Candidatus Woesearchaeota archaeon]|nr:recombinase family protein [Candidatus Woesearchaeota archaeon]